MVDPGRAGEVGRIERARRFLVDVGLEYLDLDDGSFMGGNPFTWRFSSDMDNQRSWGIGADYIVAKNLKFSVMQSFASQAKTGSPDPHEMTRIHFQMLF